MTAKTYFFQFNGYLLGDKDENPFIIERIFNTHDMSKIFGELFENEDGWDTLQDMFEHEFEYSENYDNKILGCSVPANSSSDEYDYVAAFVKHYVSKGHNQFFTDVDRTWVERQSALAYAFVQNNDMDKLLTIMKTCSSESMLADLNTEHLEETKYFKKNNKRISRNLK